MPTGAVGTRHWRVRHIAVILFLLVAVASWGRTVEEIPNVQLRDSTRFVANPDGVLTPQGEARLNQQLLSLRQHTTAEPYIAVVKGLDAGGDYNTAATELFQRLGLGTADRDNGLLVLVDVGAPNITIRTGYGLEGVLPDGLLQRLTRQHILPHFRAGRYDQGLSEGMEAVTEILTRPENAAEIAGTRSAKGRASDDWWDVLWLYIGFAATVTLIITITVFGRLRAASGHDNVAKYQAIASYEPMLKGLSWVCLGLPLITLLIVRRLMHKYRDTPRQCPNCQHPMTKMDEEHDNDYLTPSQDLEERIDSVDYDVWVCPECNEVDVFPFVRRQSPYCECPRCHARAARLVRQRIVQPPTPYQKGRGVREYTCLNCRQNTDVPYDIDKTPRPSAPIIIPGGGFRGGGSGFGGGGGFGGGSTGGGGISSGW